jgi:predicted phosphodiesterase
MLKQQRVEIVNSYLDKQSDPHFSNRTLAKKIIQENPGLFELTDRDIDNVRRMIRTRRGATGKKGHNLTRPELIRPEMKPSEYMKQYLGKAVEPKERNWKLPKEHKKVLVIGDLHIPYHNVDAIYTALDYGVSEGVDAIYLNGDIIDFAKISRWMKDPSVPSPQVEIEMVQEFLYGLKGLGLPIYYKMGNHEDRWNAYLLQSAPELYDLDALQIKSILGLEDLDIELIDSKQIAHFGKLLVIHGHEFGESTFSPVNPARGIFLRAKTSVLSGHNHQTSAHHENDLNGNPTACFSLGCLCDLSPDYRPFAFTKWNHGFAIVSIEENGYFTVDNHRIIEGRVR